MITSMLNQSRVILKFNLRYTGEMGRSAKVVKLTFQKLSKTIEVLISAKKVKISF